MKSNLVNGFDVSHHNGVFDFQKMVAMGHKFCFVKCTEGVDYVDSQFKRNWIEAAKAGLLVGAYHFFHPGMDPIQQAKHFLDTKGPERVGDLPAVIDFEVHDGVRLGVQKQNALAFMDFIYKATGKKPFFYSYRSFIQELGDTTAFESYPLWLAVYTTKVVSPQSPGAWPFYTIWQYTDSNGIDLNVLNGRFTFNDLQAMTNVYGGQR